jgi:hypothetical protein
MSQKKKHLPKNCQKERKRAASRRGGQAPCGRPILLLQKVDKVTHPSPGGGWMGRDDGWVTPIHPVQEEGWVDPPTRLYGRRMHIPPPQGGWVVPSPMEDAG